MPRRRAGPRFRSGNRSAQALKAHSIQSVCLLVHHSRAGHQPRPPARVRRHRLCEQPRPRTAPLRHAARSPPPLSPSAFRSELAIPPRLHSSLCVEHGASFRADRSSDLLLTSSRHAFGSDDDHPVAPRPLSHSAVSRLLLDHLCVPLGRPANPLAPSRVLAQSQRRSEVPAQMDAGRRGRRGREGKQEAACPSIVGHGQAHDLVSGFDHGSLSGEIELNPRLLLALTEIFFSSRRT